MPIKPVLRAASCCAVTLMLLACQTVPTNENAPPAPSLPPRKDASVSPALAEAAARATSPTLPDRSIVNKGSGVVVKGQGPAGAPPPLEPARVTGAGVVLNFEGADLREVVRNILGDILNES